MDSKEQLLTSATFTYLWVIGVSLWGGLVSYFEKKEPFSFKQLFAHLSSASFAGLMTFYLCQYGHVPEPLTGVFCGVAAHMGTPALLKMKIIRQFLDKGGMKDDDEAKSK
jgi:hypothetical protein